MRETVQYKQGKMKKTIKGVLIGAGILVVLWLCAPLMIGLMFSVSARHQYNADPPDKVTSLAVPNTDLVITLWRKQRPRAMCWEGEYRVVEVAQRDHASQFYSILPALPGDYPKLTMHWYPEKRILRFVDDGVRDGPAESIVDLNAGTVVDARGRASGETLRTDARKASATFCFPAAGDRDSSAFTETDAQSLATGDILVGVLEYTEAEGKQNSQQPPAN